ncbi:MAG TPA: hypothetical protein VFE53_09240 [Mucilaginibacter sp.]|jgi:hypothetical protein|nr:hypothetical protein [Mucilaginibacter sp.]
MQLKKTISVAALLIFGLILVADGQKVTHYNLVELFQKNMLDTASNHRQTKVLENSRYPAVSSRGIAWLKGVNFKEGAIDIDLRGKNVFLKSFLGIAFHAKDTIEYDAVYFCPFRFHDTSEETRKYAVKYVSLPGHDFDVLRRQYPGVYENEAKPAPKAEDWFHATIVIKGDWITVYVNHSTTPSLKVKKLNNLTGGMIGLWGNASVSLPSLGGDFANLTITDFPN